MAQAAAATRKTPRARFTRAALARQALVSFAVVLVCYWVYWFAAVPLIEPGVEERTTARTPEDVIQQARTDVTARQREVARYFQPGDWEADKPAIGQSGQMRLLYKTIKPRGDGTVELRPCTLMLFPKGGSGPPRPIIMRAVNGADISFDQRIDLRSVDLRERRFRGGRLIGPIRIYQQESAPGAGDELEITTPGDVTLESNRAFTPDRVVFRMGHSHGSGRDLEILLAAADGRQDANVMRSAALQTVRLNHDVRMRLESVAGPPPPGKPQTPQATEPPIEITCKGHFQFDAENYAASFHDRVDVFRLNPVGESDQLNCQLLTVFFAKPGQTLLDENAPTRRDPTVASRVRLIEARGKPVTMRSPAQGIYASCEGIDFVPGTPGSLAAYGPGVIRGKLPDDPAGTYVAQWARELRFEPDGKRQKATLRGAAVVRIGQMGTITADEVFAWMIPKPPKPGTPAAQNAQRRPQAGVPGGGAWEIERVVAQRYPQPATGSQGDVVIDSAQLHAVAATLEARIERGTPVANAAAPAAGPRQPNPADPRRPQQNPTEQFDVTGRSVTIRLVPRGDDELTIAAATIDGAAQLEQISTATGTKQRSLLVKGDQLRVTGADTPDTKVTIAGSPGYVEAGGMMLWGGAIELERAKNWLWIDGPGRLSMPMTQDLDGRPLPRPQMLTVDWKRRMDFQSNTAVFDGAVVARSAQQLLNTEKLEAILTEAIDFSNPNVGAAPGARRRADLAVVRSHGPTSLESRQFGEDGAQTTYSRMELADLSINRTSGQISGRGPGWVRHIARGAPQPFSLPGDEPAKPKPDADEGFTYLYITFRQGIDGNIDRRTIKFFDSTRTVYGPAGDWNATLDGSDLAALGPEGMTLDADALEAHEMNRRPDAKRGWFELDARGNVFAEGQHFTARGNQLTYSEEKQLIVLRGVRGGNPAEMLVDDDRLSERLEHRANELGYWVRLRRIVGGGVRGISLGLPAESQRNLPREPRQNPPAAAPR